MAKKQKTRPAGSSPGSLLLPYGTTPWHFKQGERHNDVHGTGFNGRVTHAWTPNRAIMMPGKGYVTQYDG